MFTFPTVKIVLVKSDVNRSGEMTIALQFVLKRKVRRLSLRKYVTKACWVGRHPQYVKERGADRHPNGRALNLLLGKLYNKAQGILLEYESKNKPLHWEEFLEQLYPKQETYLFETYHHLYVDGQVRKRLREGTLKTYASKLRKLLAYAPGLQIQQITEDFAREYETWLIGEKSNEPNTIYKAMQHLKSVCDVAVRHGAIETNPLAHIPLRKEIKVPSRLSEGEVKKLITLYESGVLNESRQNVLRQFLFACFTGLAYGDIVELTYEDINVQDDGVLYLDKKRHKTNQRYVAPLSTQAQRLIDYPGEGKVFRAISNQKINEYVKWCVEVVGIQKKVTFHTGRHTFGTLATNRGMRREVIQKMMGHAKPDMTDHYARLNVNTILSEGMKYLSDEEQK